MAETCFAPVDVCGAQFNRLAPDGSILNNETDVVVSCELVDITRSPILVEGRTDTSRNGAGARCAQRTVPDRIDGWNLTMTLCSRIDVALMELLGIYDLVVNDGGGSEAIGIKPPAAGTDVCTCPGGAGSPNGVSMLLWSQNAGTDGPDAALPYVIFAAPKVTWVIQDEIRSDAFTNVVLSGKLEKNTYWVDPLKSPGTDPPQGPGDVYPETAGLDRIWAEWATTDAPPYGCQCGACGYEPIGTDPYGDVVAAGP